MLGPCCPIQLGTVWNPNWVQKISIISKHPKTATVITMPSCQVSNSLGCWVKYSLRATKAKLRRYETTGSMTRAYQSSSTMPHFTLRFSDEFHHMHGYRHHYKIYIYIYRTWRTAIPSSWRIKGWDWKTMTFLLNLTPWEWIAEILHDPLDESTCIYLWKKWSCIPTIGFGLSEYDGWCGNFLKWCHSKTSQTVPNHVTSRTANF